MKTAPPGDANAAAWSAADGALWAYLFLPVPIFLAGFFVPALGIPLALVAVAAAMHFLPAPAWPRPSRAFVIDCALLALLAGAWTVFGGAGHLFHANGTDWVPRFAVLRDLVAEPWPPRYDTGGGDAMLLRAPLGYYLPPALAASFAGLPLADALLLVWTWLGVALFFGANLAGTREQKLAAALVFAFASGLDAVGQLLGGGGPLWPGQHLEWWAGGMQYSANTTLLFWVPNHGLPGWIAAAWLWRFRDDVRFLARLPVLFLPVMLWSPLVALGLLPLALAALAARRQAVFGAHDGNRQLLVSFALVALPAAFVAAYLLQGFIAAGGPATMTPPATQADSRIGATLLFIALETGGFAALLLARERPPVLLAAVAVLLVLPWLRFGPNNDLVMRASIPALAILWLALAAALTAPGPRRPRQAALFALFALGCATPYQEFRRALDGRVWPADTRLSAPAALNGFAPHYFVREADNRLAPLMRR